MSDQTEAEREAVEEETRPGTADLVREAEQVDAGAEETRADAEREPLFEAADRDRFGEDDLGLLVPAAERAALAIGRARIVERERRIAETLQRALLPERLPSIEGTSTSPPRAARVSGSGTRQ